jgi:C4-dicarboxylate-specific signal transduction histidine kinase
MKYVNPRLGRLGHLVCATLATIITVADILTPAELELAPLYVVPLIILGLTGASERSVWLWALACAIGPLLRFTGLGDPAVDQDTIQSLAIAYATLAAVAAVVGRVGRVSRNALSEQRYQTLFDTLAVAVWEHDMRPVKAATEKLRASGVSDVRAYLAANPDFVKAARRTVRITDVNATALRLMGVERKEQFFAHLSDFLPEEDASFEKCIIAIDEGHEVFASETRVRARSGELIPIIVVLYFPPGSSLDRISGCILDVRDRVRLEAALERSRHELGDALRAASLAELTTSIAHEIGQPLSAVSGYIHACQRMMDRNPPDLAKSRAILSDMEVAAERASDVVRGVKRMLIRPPAEATRFLFDPMVAEAVQIISREGVDAALRIEVDLRARDAVASGDRVLLQQVVVNLVRNALQATATVGVDEGVVHVSTRTADDCLLLEVCDNGPGFTEEGLRKAFSPFFSTRPSALGLGLSISRSTLEMHRGTIEIVTTSERGTILRVTLPPLAA